MWEKFDLRKIVKFSEWNAVHQCCTHQLLPFILSCTYACSSFANIYPPVGLDWPLASFFLANFTT